MMRLFRRLCYLLHRGRRDKELAEEMAFHRALAEQEHRDSGLDPEEARLAARRRMGNETLARESAYNVWFPAAVEGVIQDLRYAWRGLMRSKVLLTVACLSLGLSTGFGTALFSVVNAVILQPVTAERPESLVALWVGTGNRISGANLRDLCEDTPGVNCAGYRVDEMIWDSGGEPERVFAALVSPHYFGMLGIEAARGRPFAKDSVRGNRDTAVVTYAFWERRLGSDPGVIGSRLKLMGRSYIVTGVLPRGFRSIWGLGISPSIYLPAGSTARASTAGRGDVEYEMLGLPAPGQSLAEFRSRVLSRAKGLEAAYPVENRDLGRVQTFPFHRLGLLFASDKSMTQVLLLFASLIVVFVLLLAVVACLNVAGLLVARALSRQREIAIRLSIGCGRLRLARLLLAESLLLALLGIGAGAVLSVWLARLLVLTPLPFPIPFEAEVPVDTHLLAFLTVLAGMATVVAGIAPAMQAWRFPAAGAATAGRSAGTRRWPLRALLIAGQVAVSTVLVVGTTLFVRSLWVAGRVHPGFDLDRVVTVEADTRSRQLSDADAATYYREAVARLKTLPGVTAVSGALVVPLSMASIVYSVLVDRGTSEQTVTVNSNRVLPDYFRAMGIPLRAGREFGDSDRLAQPRAAVVNETFARQLFPGESRIGKRVRRPVAKGNPEPWAEIVGVVADSRYLTLGEETRPQVYWPLGPAVTSMTIHVRTEGDTGALARAIPEALAAIDSRMRAKAKPLRAVMAVALFPAQASAAMLAALGLVGWALTICGLYGLVAYTVTRRIPEIGIRVALGATPSRVIGLLLRDGLAVSVAGLAAGLAVAALATPFLGMFLAGVPPRDPASFALAAALLLATAVAASYFPARRGTKLAPAEALRTE